MKQIILFLTIMSLTFAANASKQKQHAAKPAKQISADSVIKHKRESHFSEKVAFLGSILSTAVLTESVRNTQTQP